MWKRLPIRLAMLFMAIILVPSCATSGKVAESDNESPQEVIVRVVDGPVHRASDEADAKPGDVVCKREWVTGSRFKQLICRTRRQIEADRKAAESIMQRIRQQNAAKAMGN